jgi:hypothetical protein
MSGSIDGCPACSSAGGRRTMDDMLTFEVPEDYLSDVFGSSTSQYATASARLARFLQLIASNGSRRRDEATIELPSSLPAAQTFTRLGSGGMAAGSAPRRALHVPASPIALNPHGKFVQGGRLNLSIARAHDALTNETIGPTPSSPSRHSSFLSQQARGELLTDEVRDPKGAIGDCVWVVETRIDQFPEGIHDTLRREIQDAFKKAFERRIAAGESPQAIANDLINKWEPWRGVGLPSGAAAALVGIMIAPYPICKIIITISVRIAGVGIGPPGWPREWDDLPPPQAEHLEEPADIGGPLEDDVVPPPRPPHGLDEPHRPPRPPIPGGGFVPGGTPLPPSLELENPPENRHEYPPVPETLRDRDCPIHGSHLVRFDQRLTISSIQRGPKPWRQAYLPTPLESEEMFSAETAAIQSAVDAGSYSFGTSEAAVTGAVQRAIRCPARCPTLTIEGVDGWNVDVSNVSLHGPQFDYRPHPSEGNVRGYFVTATYEIVATLTGQAWVRFRCDE